MSVRLTILVALLTAAPVLSATIHVPDDQPTIQAGLDAALTGDTVVVACGVYNESEIEIHRSVVLMSESGEPECVVIDAQYSPGSQIMRCSEVALPVEILGLTFTRALGANGQSSAAGLACHGTSATIRNCDFVDNSASMVATRASSS